MHQPRCVFCKLGGGRYVKTQLSLYPIYYTDDMFRPLWDILRSQKYVVKKAIQYKSISCGAYSKLSRSRCHTHSGRKHVVSLISRIQRQLCFDVLTSS